MRPTHLFALCLAFVAGAGPAPVAAQNQPDAPADTIPDVLLVGDKAPPLKIDHWVRGEPIEQFKEGRVYAVEFWATWCGPCIVGIPHLAEVQERFKEHADLISVTTRDESNTLDTVREFVASRDDMQYRVAFDRADFTWRSYMQAAGQGGIPCAFIIDKQSRVAWIGHPADPAFEKTIAAIIADEYDIEEAAREAAEQQGKADRIAQAQAELHAAWDAGDHERAFDLADQIIESDPESTKQWAWWKFDSLLNGIEDPDRAYAYVRGLMEGHYAEDPDMLTRFAYAIGDSIGIENPDLDLALDLAERAVTLTFGSDHEQLVALSVVRMAREEFDQGVAVLKRAIDVAPDDRTRAYLRNELDFYEWERDRAAQRKAQEEAERETGDSSND